MSDKPESEPAHPRPIIDHEDAATPRQETAPPHAAPPTPAPRRGGTPFGVTLLFTAALAGGIYYTWTHPHLLPEENDPTQAIDSVRAALQQQVANLDSRLGKLEAGGGQTGKLTALETRIARLEQQQGTAPASNAADAGAGTADLAKRVDDLGAHLNEVSAQQAQQNAALEKLAAAQQAPVAAPAPPEPPQPDQSRQALADLTQKLDQTLAAQKSSLDELAGRLGKLEQQNGGAADSQQKLQETAQAAQQNATDTAHAVAALDARMKTLEQGEGQIATAKQAAQQNANDNAQAIATLDVRIKTLEQAESQVATVKQATQQNATESAQAITTLNARVKTLEQGEGQIATVRQDATLAVKLAAAQAALSNGQPLGALPGAPPALARFAKAPPPTIPALKASFPGVAEKALAASRPVEQQHSFLGRVLARVEQSVTVRQGDHVIVGDPAAGVLARAQHALDDDDLRGAIMALSALTGPAADAVQDWTGQVRALVDARDALAAMAHS